MISLTLAFALRSQLDRSHDLRDHELVNEIVVIALGQEGKAALAQDARPRSSSS